MDYNGIQMPDWLIHMPTRDHVIDEAVWLYTGADHMWFAKLDLSHFIAGKSSQKIGPAGPQV